MPVHLLLLYEDCAGEASQCTDVTQVVQAHTLPELVPLQSKTADSGSMRSPESVVRHCRSGLHALCCWMPIYGKRLCPPCI
jgi:hypothetical protein